MYPILYGDTSTWSILGCLFLRSILRSWHPICWIFIGWHFQTYPPGMPGIGGCLHLFLHESLWKLSEHMWKYMNMYVDRHLKPPRQSWCGFYFGKYSKGASHCLCHPLAPNFSKYGLALMVGLGHSCLSCPSDIPVEAHSIPKSSINRYPLLSTPFKKYFYRYHWYIYIYT